MYILIIVIQITEHKAIEYLPFIEIFTGKNIIGRDGKVVNIRTLGKFAK